MTRNWKKITKIVAISGAIFICILISGVLNEPLTHIGIYINISPIKMADRLASENKSARTCLRLITLDLWGGPSEGSQQRSCIYEFAEVTKDPAACKLLMPSEYGMACFGVVWSELDQGDGCDAFPSEGLICSTGSGSVQTVAQTKDCTTYNNVIFRDWCYSERTRTLPNTNECEKISPIQRRKDECLHGLAFKERNVAICNQIVGEAKRKLCILRLSMRQQYPSLFR